MDDQKITAQNIISSHLSYRIGQIQMKDGGKPLYNCSRFFELARNNGFDVRGVGSNFNIYRGRVKLVLDSEKCQFEGIYDNFYPDIKIKKCTQDGLMQLVRDIPDIVESIDKDIELANELIEQKKVDMQKQDMIANLNCILAKSCLDNYFKNRGYWYKITESDKILQFSVDSPSQFVKVPSLDVCEKKLHVRANLSKGRKIEFDVECTNFAENNKEIMNYISNLIAAVEKNPMKVKIF